MKPKALISIPEGLADRRTVLIRCLQAAGGAILIHTIACDREKENEGLIAKRDDEVRDPEFGAIQGEEGVREKDEPMQIGDDPNYEGTALVDPGDATAKALGYVEDAKDSPRRKDARFGIPAGSQYCNNCQHFTAAGEQEGRPVGRCEVIRTGFVEANGWCTAWMAAD